MALAPSTPGGHPGFARRALRRRRRRVLGALPAVDAVDTTGAGDVFAGVLAANWPPNPGSAGERRLALRRACAAGALATLVPGAGDCAPDAEAIDKALQNAS